MFNFSNAIKIISTVVFILVSACSDRTENAKKSAEEASQKKSSVEIIKWGPKNTIIGEGFSMQSDGNAAIWFEQKGIDRKEDIKIFFDGTELGGVAIIPNSGGSAEVPMSLLQEEGKFPIYIMLNNGDKVDLGTFKVIAKPQ